MAKRRYFSGFNSDAMCFVVFFFIGNPLLYMGVLHKNWKFRLLLNLEVFPTLGCA